MLPSTGYFKAINCPFYESGSCERPYCHFRHAKRDVQNSVNNDGNLHNIASAASTNVLQNPDNIAQKTSENKGNITATNSKATYNPTPISELNKINSNETGDGEDLVEQKRRHIPVPYTPSKPMSMPTKRPIDNNGFAKPFVYTPVTKYTPGVTDNVAVDPYLPKGSNGSTEKYLPGTEKPIQEYTPATETHVASSVSYVPSDKADINKKFLEYKPATVVNKPDVPKVTYQPTPRAQVPCFSSDEDEPSLKKSKLRTDISNLDELEDEFNILDQILDEEKNTDISDKSGKIEIKDSNKKSRNKVDEKKHKALKDKSDKKVHKDDKSSDRKSSRKSSHKDKHKDKNRDDKKSRERSSSKSSRSRSSEKQSKKPSHSSKDSKHLSSEKNNSGDKRDERKMDKHKHKDHKHSKERSSKRKHSKDKSKDKDSSKKKTDHNRNSDCDYDYIDEDDIEDDDPETITLECRKIFEEYKPTEKALVPTIIADESDNQEEETYIPAKKRISRTEAKNVRTIPRAPIKPDFKENAAQTMTQRIAKIREFHESRQTLPPPETKIETPKCLFSTTPSSNKIRIAHVPYASNMINAKKDIPVTPQPKSSPSTSSTTTIVHTVKKGEQRIAHVPSDKFIDRPGVLEPLASKIAANIRSTYLNMMIDECLKIYILPADAYNRAQHEELITSKKCSTVQIYKNSAVLAVSRLRKESAECNGVKKSASECSTLQRVMGVKSGPLSTPSWSIERNKKNVDTAQQFIGSKFYKNISKWILTEEQLQENGFPRTHPCGEKGKAKIYVENKRQRPPKGLIRVCSRCKKDYIVNKKGFPEVKEECVYHPNNKYRFRGEVRYQCCSQDGSSEGCCIAPVHVYEYVDYENLRGYVKTLPPEKQSDDYGVYALDCEMCYTTHGLDLTRVTVIDSSCKTVYETLIKPLHPIIDYNTRYSGITEEHMAEVKTTLLEVQATMLSMFNSKTILLGHSLESDFKALKLIHDTVIDTSVLFPHKMGPPYKRALRNLSSEYLRKIIQNSVDGHDSAEDATVCMELILHKLREDLKTR